MCVDSVLKERNVHWDSTFFFDSQSNSPKYELPTMMPQPVPELVKPGISLSRDTAQPEFERKPHRPLEEVTCFKVFFHDASCRHTHT